ncbi:unnamed protein product [Timema podura]|uniref:Prolactin receptor n=1 Tax=Timema podura TaxID=61482 RepID=A0ABN7NG57_TIMPD|nr:unnamed protein product [Timema podura]
MAEKFIIGDLVPIMKSDIDNVPIKYNTNAHKYGKDQAHLHDYTLKKDHVEKSLDVVNNPIKHVAETIYKEKPVLMKAEPLKSLVPIVGKETLNLQTFPAECTAKKISPNETINGGKPNLNLSNQQSAGICFSPQKSDLPWTDVMECSSLSVMANESNVGNPQNSLLPPKVACLEGGGRETSDVTCMTHRPISPHKWEPGCSVDTWRMFS